MDLPQHVAQALGLERDRAVQCLSQVFTSIRMRLDPGTFARLSAALPDLDAWLREIQFTTSRTGEMVSLGSPEALRRQLELLGLRPEQIAGLGQVLAGALERLLPPDLWQQLAAKIPLLGEAGGAPTA